MSLKTIANAVVFERQPFARMVRWRTAANVLSIGFEVLRESVEGALGILPRLGHPDLLRGALGFWGRARAAGAPQQGRCRS
jgi:hypothetical protein